jgi:hypothetical protein
MATAWGARSGSRYRTSWLNATSRPLHTSGTELDISNWSGRVVPEPLGDAVPVGEEAQPRQRATDPVDKAHCLVGSVD